MATTAKRGPKAAPKSKPGAFISKTLRNATSTKAGPGRRYVSGHTHAVERVKKAGGYGQGLLNVRTRKQRDAIEAKRTESA